MGALAGAWGGGCVHVLCCWLSGALAGVMERMRCCVGEGLCPVGRVSSAIWRFGVGPGQRWWGLVGVQWQGELASIGTGRPGGVACASAG